MWIVRLALRQPYTVAVAAAVILLMGVLAMRSMLVDIFPAIDIPVVAVVWTYPGLSAEDMEKRVVLMSERGLSSVVDGIQRIESESIPGHRHAQGVLPAGHEHRQRDRADNVVVLDFASTHAARHPAAVHHPVERVERPRRAAHHDEQHDAGGEDLRLRAELPAAAALHGAGTLDTGAVRRQDARDHDRCGPAQARRKGIVGQRCA